MTISLLHTPVTKVIVDTKIAHLVSSCIKTESIFLLQVLAKFYVENVCCCEVNFCCWCCLVNYSLVPLGKPWGNVFTERKKCKIKTKLTRIKQMQKWQTDFCKCGFGPEKLLEGVASNWDNFLLNVVGYWKHITVGIWITC